MGDLSEGALAAWRAAIDRNKELFDALIKELERDGLEQRPDMAWSINHDDVRDLLLAGFNDQQIKVIYRVVRRIAGRI